MTKIGKDSRVSCIEVAKALTEAAMRQNLLCNRKLKNRENAHTPIHLLVCLPLDMKRIQLSGIKDGCAITEQRIRVND